jgi:GNAT superfamily N-acetyltransferase
MTTNTPHDQHPDRFGLSDLEAAVAPRHPPDQASPPVDGWVPVRDLHARHRGRILDHLLQLNERDRYLRFGHTVNATQLGQYVASIDFKRDEVFGIFDRRLHLVAMAHLAAMPGKGPHEGPHGQGSSRGRAMEFGVSVLPEGRGKGLGLRLFQHAIVHARNQHASHLMIHALTENAPMLRIAAKAGALIERHGVDSEAWLKLPPDTVGTHLDSSLQSLGAEVVYRLKYQAMHVSDWLRTLISPA